MSRVDDQPYYASRTLVPGRTLVASDLAVGRPVVVLTEALPARSFVTEASLIIEERAVNVPHDAIESLQGWACSQLIGCSTRRHFAQTRSHPGKAC